MIGADGNDLDENSRPGSKGGGRNSYRQSRDTLADIHSSLHSAQGGAKIPEKCLKIEKATIRISPSYSGIDFLTSEAVWNLYWPQRF